MGFGMFSFHPANCLSLREDIVDRAGVPCRASPQGSPGVQVWQHPCPAASPEAGARDAPAPSRVKPLLDLLLYPVAEAASSPTRALSPRSGSNSLGLAAQPRSSSGMNIDGAAGCGGKTHANLIRVTGAGLPGGAALPFPDINVTLCHKAFFNAACQ